MPRSIEAQLLAHARRVRTDGMVHSIAARQWATEVIATLGWMDPPRRAREDRPAPLSPGERDLVRRFAAW